MTNPPSDNTELKALLQQAGLGDNAAFDALVHRNCERLTTLARHMLNSYSRVRRWTETDDVLQSALLRLHNALKDIQPTSIRDFFSLAALQLRRELIDLARTTLVPRAWEPITIADRATRPTPTRRPTRIKIQAR